MGSRTPKHSDSRLVSYSRDKCRCKDCVEAWNKYYRDRRARINAAKNDEGSVGITATLPNDGNNSEQSN